MSARKVVLVAVPVAVAALAVWLAAGRGAANDVKAQAPVPPDAAAIHQRALVLDAHVDILIPDTPDRYRDDDGDSHASLQKLKAGGVDAVVLSLAVGPGDRNAAGFKAARAEIETKRAYIDDFVKAGNGAVVLASSADEVEAAARDAKIAVIVSFLNARSLGKDLAGIDDVYRRDVRVFGLAHAGHNDWADSSRPQGAPPAEHGGLSPLGRQAIARLNDLGVLVDVSQLTTDGVQQVLALTRAPVIASHSAVRSLVENTRNLSDAELDAIKANGGVVHVPAFNSYLLNVGPEARARLAEVRRQYGLPPEVAPGVSPNDGYPTLPADRQGEFNAAVTAAIGRASVRDLVDHIDYIAKRIGVEHVGIGTDFNHGSGIEGFESLAEAGNVTAELVRRGYTEEQVAKIWGGNFLRVLRAAEAARKS